MVRFPEPFPKPSVPGTLTSRNPKGSQNPVFPEPCFLEPCPEPWFREPCTLGSWNLAPNPGSGTGSRNPGSGTGETSGRVEQCPEHPEGYVGCGPRGILLLGNKSFSFMKTIVITTEAKALETTVLFPLLVALGSWEKAVRADFILFGDLSLCFLPPTCVPGR